MAEPKTEYGTVVSQDDVELNGSDELNQANAPTLSNPQILEVSLCRIVSLLIKLSLSADA